MRIAVIGTGAVGGYFGAKLAAGGSEVTFGARGAHGDAIRRNGLEVLSDLGNLHIEAVPLVGPDTDPCDIVVLATKMYDLESAAETALSLLQPGTAVIPLQNGVEAVDILKSKLPDGSVCGGVAYIGGHIEKPGVVRHVGTMARMVFGELDGQKSARLQGLENACASANLDCLFAPDIEAQIWRKFVFLAPFAAITCFARGPIGEVRDNPALWRRYGAMVRETVAVARAKGVPLPEDIAEDRIAFTGGLPEGMKSSMLTDLQADRKLELDWLTGAVVRIGQTLGVPTPVSAETYAAIVTSLPKGY